MKNVTLVKVDVSLIFVLGSLESTQEAVVARATPRATLTHLPCSPNFPRASYLNERTLTYKSIVS